LGVTLFGPVATHNALVLGSLLFAAIGTHLLARSLGMKGSGALIAGTAFGFNNLALTYGAANGDSEMASMAWVPWFFLALHHLIRNPTFLSAAATGFALYALGAASTNWLVIVPPLTLIVAIPQWLEAAKTKENLTPNLVRWGLFAGIVSGFTLWLQTEDDIQNIINQSAIFASQLPHIGSQSTNASVSATLHEYGNLSAYLLPGAEQLVIGNQVNQMVQSTYIGWFAMFLGILGLRPGTFRWFAMGLVATTLSLGPFFVVDSISWRASTTSLWSWTTTLIPAWDWIISPVHFAPLGLLSASVLAGFGGQAIVDKIPSDRVQATLFWIPAAIVISECIWASPTPWPVPATPAWIPQTSYVLAEASQPGAVLDWPNRYADQSTEVSRYAYYQSAHKRPIAYDFAESSLVVGEVEKNDFFLSLEAITYGSNYQSIGGTVSINSDPDAGILALKKMGYAFLVVHPWHISSQRLEITISWLNSHLPLFAELDDGGLIYEMDVLEDLEL